MIIKITSSARRISISGTTFGSAATPRLPPTTIPMSHLANFRARGLSHPAKKTRLLPCFELGGDQTDLVDTGAAHDVDGLGDVLEHRFVIAFYESDFFGAFLEDLLDARAELVKTGIFLIDLDLALFADLDDNGFVFEILILLLIGIRLRHKGIETLGNQGRDDHENDDQHEKNINQRNYVW